MAKKSKNLINEIRNISMNELQEKLSSCYEYLKEATKQYMTNTSNCNNHLNSSICLFKRQKIQLSPQLKNDNSKVISRHDLIGKDKEGLIEMINMLATLERLIYAIQWFSEQPEHYFFKVQACHPTSSSSEKENDLMLTDNYKI
jgi:hypothetical protein